MAHLVAHSVYIGGLLLCLVLMGTRPALGHNFPPNPWSRNAIDACHEERKTRVGEEGWGDPETYRMADKIGTSLWLGNVCAAMDEDFLRENNIGLVISMAEEWPFVGSIPSGIQYEHFALRDSGRENESQIKQTLTAVAIRILTHFVAQGYDATPNQELWNGVLVYCNMGISRSTTAVVYTLMKIERIVPSAPSDMYPRLYHHYMNVVQGKRPVAKPNRQYRAILEKSSNISLKTEL